MAFAAPVVVGMMEEEAARARRRSRCGASCRFWSPVIEWTVVIYPSFMPQFWSKIFTKGATLFVVHEALEKRGVFQSKSSSLTPSTTVGTSLSGEGAEMMTCSAPAPRCKAAFSRLVKKPVDSTTAFMLRALHGSRCGVG